MIYTDRFGSRDGGATALSVQTSRHRCEGLELRCNMRVYLRQEYMVERRRDPDASKHPSYVLMPQIAPQYSRCCFDKCAMSVTVGT
jgi:hypothetical protein